MTDAWVQELLDAPRVRVWDGQHLTVRAEGKVIGVITGPSVTIEDDEGVRHHEALSLPVDIEHREWRSR